MNELLHEATSPANAEVAFYFVNNIKLTISLFLIYVILT